MPIRDVEAMNRSLDNDYGTTRGPNAASSHLLCLFDGDPLIPADDGGGVELDASDNPGYGRVAVSPSAWLAATDGRKDTVPLTFPDTEDEWEDAPTHWLLLDGDDETTAWDYGPLSEPLEVTAAGPGPVITVSVFYDDAVIADAE